MTFYHLSFPTLSWHDNITGCSVSDFIRVPEDCSSSASGNEVLSILKQNKDEINVFPNPFGDLLHVSIISEQEQILQIKIVDIVGKTIYNEEVKIEVGVNKMTIDMETTSIIGGLCQVIIKGRNQTPQNFKVVRIK